MAAVVYGAAIARRNRAFDRGRGIVTFDRPVISVGNLSTGGTGKTPMVAWIVGVLREAGHDPCVAMRGYRSRGGVSDEAEEYRRAFEGLPVVVRPDRVSGLIGLFNTDRGERVDTIVLDDGFQHRRIARELDLVLIDASRDPFADALLPAGHLREPVESIRRATHVVITHAELAAPDALARLCDRVERARDAPPDAVTEHAWSAVDTSDATHTGPPALRESTPASSSARLDWLRGRRVVAVCAIGNPRAFLASLEATGAHIAGRIVLRDHDPYAPATLARIARAVRAGGAQAVITTAKDWTKLSCHDLSAWGVPVVRPLLELRFRGGEAGVRDAVLAAAWSGDPDG